MNGFEEKIFSNDIFQFEEARIVSGNKGAGVGWTGCHDAEGHRKFF